MVGENSAIRFDDVMIDLTVLRDRGSGYIRDLALPTLSRAVTVLDLTDGEAEERPAAISSLLREAADRLGGGVWQEAAEYSLGLVRGTQRWPKTARRAAAANLFDRKPDTYRKSQELEVLRQMADAVLELCHEARLRRSRIDMENQRHPADSRLAVQWVERFEAYNRLWTPAYALAANLEAALDTYLEEPAPHPPWDPNSISPYVPEKQARHYARAALYNLVEFQLGVKRFRSKHGGLWLMSDSETETKVSDAVYRIEWHNNLTSEDESWLRRNLADSRHEEFEHFWRVILSFPDGVRIHDKWQDLVRDGVGLTTDSEKEHSQVWLTIRACNDYMQWVDADWLKIADWYRPGSTPERGISAGELYNKLLGARSS
ncbi:hypothetical protein [Subtercola lobariae]|nr:hypothetical protein [Subtercola lobariae]